MKANTKELERLERDLLVFAEKAYPFATKKTINDAAWETRKGGLKEIKASMTLRNRWTASSVRVENATSMRVSDQQAIVGSIEDYMRRQELGGVVVAKGKGQPIATRFAAGQGRGSGTRTKLPRRANTMAKIAVARRGLRAKNRKQRNALAVRAAGKRGASKFVFLDLGRRRGLFRVKGKGRAASVDMVWDLSHKTVRTPANPWLLPASEAARSKLPEFYRRALRFQLRRHGILGR